MHRTSLWLQSLLLASVALPAAAATANVPDHIVVVIEENQKATTILGSANAPYINNVLAAGGLVYLNAHGTDHDSQPNYVELFSGANPGIQGVSSVANGGVLPQHYDPSIDIQTPVPGGPIANALNNSDNPNAIPFSAPNLGSSLAAAGKTFTGYSEDLPSVGSTVNSAKGSQGFRSYVQKHNPWVQWQGAGSNQLPATDNQPFSAFPTNFSTLPNVAVVVPNEANDMHDIVSKDGLYAVGAGPFGTGFDKNGNPVDANTTIQGGDNWLKNNIDAYRQWATTHNSLLITLWDENDYTNGPNTIAEIIDGAPNLLQQGTNNAYVNHFDTLKYLETVFGGAPTGLAATADGLPINAAGQLAVAVAEPATIGLLGFGLAGLIAVRRRRA